MLSFEEITADYDGSSIHIVYMFTWGEDFERCIDREKAMRRHVLRLQPQAGHIFTGPWPYGPWIPMI